MQRVNTQVCTSRANHQLGLCLYYIPTCKQWVREEMMVIQSGVSRLTTPSQAKAPPPGVGTGVLASCLQASLVKGAY